MTVNISDIVRALDELKSYEEGFRFQQLAVILAKQKWPELIAHERKSDNGLDAHASAVLAPDKVGKGLACSITDEYSKIAADAKDTSVNFKDVSVLIFATSQKVTRKRQEKWIADIKSEYGYTLVVMTREEIVTSLMDPRNASLCKTHLNMSVEVEEDIKDIIAKIGEANDELISNWSKRLDGKPIIDLLAIKLDQNGKELSEKVSLKDILDDLLLGRRIVLEAPAGRGKTTMLIQLSKQHSNALGASFIIDLPSMIRSRKGMLQFISEMPQYLSRGIDAGKLAQVYDTKHFTFLLNGWNEISEVDSNEALVALEELERDYPAAGIIVATRTHHIVPPLPGAMRVRLLQLNRTQRASVVSYK